ncbi:MAG: hypothetical protein ACU0CO_08870 [Shimia sp.]
MRTLLNIADDIPGLVKAALLFNAKTISEGTVSALWLKDGEAEVILNLDDGLTNVDNDAITKPMRSYMTGLAEVGAYLKARHKTDEDGVSEDDIERAALALAFPKVTRDEAARDMLKTHLDALQEFGVIEKLQVATDGAAPAKAEAEAGPKKAPEAPAAKPAEKAEAKAAPAQTARPAEATKAQPAAAAKPAQGATDKPADAVKPVIKAAAATATAAVAGAAAKAAPTADDDEEDSAKSEEEIRAIRAARRERRRAEEEARKATQKAEAEAQKIKEGDAVKADATPATPTNGAAPNGTAAAPATPTPPPAQPEPPQKRGFFSRN